MCLLTYSRVLLVSDQPVKLGVAPQAHSSPALDGDVAAAGIEVPQDHHILVGREEAEREVHQIEITHIILSRVKPV